MLWEGQYYKLRRLALLDSFAFHQLGAALYLSLFTAEHWRVLHWWVTLQGHNIHLKGAIKLIAAAAL